MRDFIHISDNNRKYIIETSTITSLTTPHKAQPIDQHLKRSAYDEDTMAFIINITCSKSSFELRYKSEDDRDIVYDVIHDILRGFDTCSTSTDIINNGGLINGGIISVRATNKHLRQESIARDKAEKAKQLKEDVDKIVQEGKQS